MLGTLIVAGAGALAFKLGMDSQRKLSEGRSVGDVLFELPGDAASTVASAACAVADAVARPFSDDSNGQGGQDGQDGQDGAPKDSAAT